jgi:hypothetical protein
LGFCPPCCINLCFPRKPFCPIGCLGVQSPNVSMKAVCLFVFFSYTYGLTEPGGFRLCSWSLWKALKGKGCIGLVPWCLDLWCKSS